MKLLNSTKGKITKDESGEIVPELEITEVVLVHCNIENNGYEHHSRVLHAFVTKRSFGQLLDNSEFSYIKLWFTDRNSKPLETEDKLNISYYVKCKLKQMTRYSVQSTD